MIEILITLVPSICWILYRCFQILKTPVEEIIEDLNMEIPHSPNLCIDSISETSIIIHWDIEIKFDENIYYVLVINGHEGATITSTSCKLNNLSPKQLYQIQIIAINAITNFRSQSNPVFVHTINKKDSKLQFIYDDKLDELDNETTISNTEKLVAEERLTHNSEGRPPVDIDNITIEEIQTIKSSDLLNDYLLAFQNELIKINQEFKSYQINLGKENEQLQNEFKFYKQEYDEETDNKMKKDSDVKSLEKSKDKLTFKKSKLNNQLNTIKSSMEMFNSKLLDYQQRIKKLEERNSQLLNNENSEKLKINDEISQVNTSIQNYKEENENIEENLKSLLAEKKEIASVLSLIRPLINLFNAPPAPISNGVSSSVKEEEQQNQGAPSSPSSSTSPSPSPAPPSSSSIFFKDGTINKSIYDILGKIFQIVPSWQDEILKEINTYQDLENKWKESFQAEIKKYVTLHQTLQIAKQNNDETYQPIKLSEYQASIEFGGFGNALTKPKFAGKRNFSPSFDDSASVINSANGSGFHNHYVQVYSDGPENASSERIQYDDQAGNSGIDATIDQQLFGTTSPPLGNPILTSNVNSLETQLTSPLIGNATLLQQPTIAQSSQLQGFPYDDSIYTTGIASPIPDHQHSQLQNMNYGGDNLNSLLYNYNSPSITHATLTGTPVTNPSVSSLNAPSTGNDINLLQPRTYNNGSGNVDTQGFLMTPTTSSKLWLDASDSLVSTNDVNAGTNSGVAGTIASGHTRSVSNNSQIWRNDNNLSTHNFNLGGVGEFQPFASSLHFPTNLSTNVSGNTTNAPLATSTTNPPLSTTPGNGHYNAQNLNYFGQQLQGGESTNGSETFLNENKSNYGQTE
ncbi:uncharacterized protein RJT20DRAFT_96613 [Scheffersomyces xylosifermentans]|uniref:uncharacterized protein n=1 Tax=Scheffersomyces xylosifermentans TaxID=1304137 RepID=UPI00315C9EE9